MTLIFVHFRWNDPGPDRYEEIVRAIPQHGGLPPGCLSRQFRRQGGALMATEAWDDADAPGGRMDQLVTLMRTAGVEDPPQTAMFSVPAMYAVGYRRPARVVADDAPAAAPAIPQQRGAPTPDRLTETAEASATAGE